MRNIHWHKHHLKPRYIGGTDDPSNLVKCNTAMHMFFHWLRYKEYDKEADKLAYMGLAGLIGKDEIIDRLCTIKEEAIERSRKRTSELFKGSTWFNNGKEERQYKDTNEVPVGWVKGRKPRSWNHPVKGKTLSEEHKQKLRGKRKGKRVMTPIGEFVDCHEASDATGYSHRTIRCYAKDDRKPEYYWME